MLAPEVMDYYRRGGERDRLGARAGKLEFVRTWDVLTRVLPVIPARLDDLLSDEATIGLMLEMLRKLEDEPSLLGASSHQLTIARR